MILPKDASVIMQKFKKEKTMRIFNHGHSVSFYRSKVKNRPIYCEIGLLTDKGTRYIGAHKTTKKGAERQAWSFALSITLPEIRAGYLSELSHASICNLKKA